MDVIGIFFFYAFFFLEILQYLQKEKGARYDRMARSDSGTSENMLNWGVDLCVRPMMKTYAQVASRRRNLRSELRRVEEKIAVARREVAELEKALPEKDDFRYREELAILHFSQNELQHFYEWRDAVNEEIDRCVSDIDAITGGYPV